MELESPLFEALIGVGFVYSAGEDGAWVDSKSDQGGTGFQSVESPVLDPRGKETCFKKA